MRGGVPPRVPARGARAGVNQNGASPARSGATGSTPDGARYGGSHGSQGHRRGAAEGRHRLRTGTRPARLLLGLAGFSAESLDRARDVGGGCRARVRPCAAVSAVVDATRETHPQFTRYVPKGEYHTRHVSRGCSVHHGPFVDDTTPPLTRHSRISTVHIFPARAFFPIRTRSGCRSAFQAVAHWELNDQACGSAIPKRNGRTAECRAPECLAVGAGIQCSANV